MTVTSDSAAMSDPVDIDKAIRDKLMGFFSQETGQIVTKFVVVIEALAPDGDRELTMIVNEGAKTWDVSGMLDEAQKFNDNSDEELE